VMEELSLFPEGIDDNLPLLFVSFDDESHVYAFEAISKLRNAGISADIYPKAVKMKKQMKYANDRNFPFVAIAGEEERNSRTFTVKNMKEGSQERLTIEQIIQKFSN